MARGHCRRRTADVHLTRAGHHSGAEAPSQFGKGVTEVHASWPVQRASHRSPPSFTVPHCSDEAVHHNATLNKARLVNTVALVEKRRGVLASVLRALGARRSTLDSVTGCTMSDARQAQGNAHGQCAVVVLSSILGDRRLVMRALPQQRLEFCAYARDAIGLLTKTGAPMLVSRMRDVGETLTLELAREVLLRAPRFTVAALLSAAEVSEDQALILTRIGVANVLVDSDRGVGAKLAVLTQRATFLARRRALAESCAEGLPPDAAWLVREAIERGDRPRTVSEFRASVGLKRGVLERRARALLGVEPHELIAWGRLGAVIVQVESSLAPIAHIADALQFPSASALHNEFQRYLGMKAREVVAGGGSAFFASLLHARFPRP